MLGYMRMGEFHSYETKYLKLLIGFLSLTSLTKTHRFWTL